MRHPTYARSQISVEVGRVSEVIPRISWQLKKMGLLLLGASVISSCAGLKVLWQHPTPSSTKAICWTFDDGPNGEATERVLEVLRKHHIRATFFLIGRNVEREPALARRIVEAGHTVGNHSYSHDTWLAFQSKARIRQNLERTNTAIVNATGTRPTYFRPPNGLLTSRLQQVCADLGLTPIGVHIFINDSFSTNPQWMAKQVLRRLRGGTTIVVLHDGWGTFRAPSRVAVAQAVELLIPEFERQGYAWVTIDEVRRREN